jgi:hypothetical protein
MTLIDSTALAVAMRDGSTDDVDAATAVKIAAKR